MNVNEFGVSFLFSTGYAMNNFTTIAITFTKPDLTEFTVTNPDVTVPNTPITTVDGTFPANEYAKYVFKGGDVDQVGKWSARVTYDDNTPLHLISDIGVFTINP